MKKLLTFLCLLIPCNAFCRPDLPEGVSWVGNNDDIFTWNYVSWGCNATDVTYNLGDETLVYFYLIDQPLKIIRCSAANWTWLFVNDQYVNKILPKQDVWCPSTDLKFNNPNGLISTDKYTVSIIQNPYFKDKDSIWPSNSGHGIFIHGCVSIKCNEGFVPDRSAKQCVEPTPPEEEANNIKNTVDETEEKIKDTATENGATGPGVKTL